MIYSKAAEPELHVPLDGPHDLPEAQATVAEGFGEAPVEPEGVRADQEPEPLHRRTTPTTRTGGRTSTTGHADRDCGDDGGGTPARRRRTGGPPGPRSGASVTAAAVTVASPIDSRRPGEARGGGFRLLLPPPASCDSRRCSRCRSAGCSSSTSARCSSSCCGLLGHELVHRRDRARLHARQLPADLRGARLP